MLQREWTQEAAGLLSGPKEPDAATLPMLSVCPDRVPAAGSERPAVMRHLCWKCIPEFLHGQHHLIMGTGRLISLARVPSSETSGHTGWIQPWELLQHEMASLGVLCKGEFLSKCTNYSKQKWNMAKKKALQIKNKVYQKPVQNYPISVFSLFSWLFEARAHITQAGCTTWPKDDLDLPASESQVLES